MIQKRLQTYWIGGSPCAGKSTIALAITTKYGWQRYSLDEHFDRHVQSASPAEFPLLHQWQTMHLESFLSMPAKQQLSHVWQLSAENFRMIMQDITDFDPEIPVLIEGSNLLPEDIVQVLTAPHHAIWIMPSELFLRTTYPIRGEWVQGVLDSFKNPQIAWQQWMKRDAMMAVQAKDRAEQSGIQTIIVDGQSSLIDNQRDVETHFQIMSL